MRATVLAIGISIDTPKDDLERQIAVVNDEGCKIGYVPEYSEPSYENPAR
jgi:hypothetical protein